MGAKFKRFMQTSRQSTTVSAALLFVRIVMGVAFMIHGWGKIQNPMGWMGPDAPVPGVLQLLGALSEFGGGLALIVGLLTPLASLGLAFTMLGATMLHAVINGDPFVSKGGASYELALMYLSLSLFFMACGAGKYSLDAKIFGTR